MYSKVKTHIREHKELYIGIGVGIGVAGVTTLIVRGINTNPIRSELLVPAQSELLVLGKKIANLPLEESRTVLVAGAESTDSLMFAKSLFGSATNVVTTIHHGVRGHPGFVTKCIETGELFATQGDAARAFNIPVEMLSKHLNHGRELVENLHFERVGILQ